MTPTDADRALAARVRTALEAAFDRLLYAALNRLDGTSRGRINHRPDDR